MMGGLLLASPRSKPKKGTHPKRQAGFAQKGGTVAVHGLLHFELFPNASLYLLFAVVLLLLSSF